jgi:hypothetical protein
MWERRGLNTITWDGSHMAVVGETVGLENRPSRPHRGARVRGRASSCTQESSYVNPASVVGRRMRCGMPIDIGLPTAQHCRNAPGPVHNVGADDGARGDGSRAPLVSVKPSDANEDRTGRFWWALESLFNGRARVSHGLCPVIVAPGQSVAVGTKVPAPPAGVNCSMTRRYSSYRRGRCRWTARADGRVAAVRAVGRRSCWRSLLLLAAGRRPRSRAARRWPRTGTAWHRTRPTGRPA